MRGKRDPCLRAPDPTCMDGTSDLSPCVNDHSDLAVPALCNQCQTRWSDGALRRLQLVRVHRMLKLHPKRADVWGVSLGPVQLLPSGGPEGDGTATRVGLG